MRTGADPKDWKHVEALLDMRTVKSSIIFAILAGDKAKAKEKEVEMKGRRRARRTLQIGNV